MPDNLVLCPLCNLDNSSLFDQRNFRGFQVTNRLCSNCGFVYQSPRMLETELKEFYISGYRQIYQGTEEPDQKDIAVQEARSKGIINLLRDWGVEQVKRFLDIGASTGTLIENIKNEYRCDAFGIEPGSAYQAYARSREIDVFGSLDELLASGEKKFDLISMIHVLEHLPDPVKYMKDLRFEYLDDRGKILIEVPNLFAHDSFEIAHLTSFSRHTLYEVMKKAGFRTIFVETHGRPRSNMIPLYISLLAVPEVNPWEQPEIEIERLIRIKRNAGLAHRKLIEKLFPNQAWLPEYHS